MIRRTLCITGLLGVSLMAMNTDSLWATLTLRQKAAQMVLVYHSPVFFLQKHEFGGVLVMSPALRHHQTFKNNLDTLLATLKVPLIVSLDQEGGRVNRLSRFAEWKNQPSAHEQARWSSDSLKAYARRVGYKLSQLGINTNLAPVLDPGIDAQGSPTFMAMSLRAYGNSPVEISTAAKSFAEGMAQAGILCVAKHYPGYDSKTNSDHEIAISFADSSAISRYRAPFKTLQSSIQSVMMSSVIFKQVSQAPAVFDPLLVNMARLDNPEAIIMTDDLWGAALRAWISKKDHVDKYYSDEDFKTLALTAVRAGNDMLIITYPIKAVELVDLLVNEAQHDSVILQHIELSSRRILAVKGRQGLFNKQQEIRRRLGYERSKRKVGTHHRSKPRSRAASQPSSSSAGL